MSLTSYKYSTIKLKLKKLQRLFKDKDTALHGTTEVIFLKAIKGKSQNRISLKQQRFLKNDKNESFLDFYLVYKYVCLKMR